MTPLTSELKKQEIIDHLTWDASVNANDINVEVTDGTVRLKGSVPTYKSKIAAESDVYRVTGIDSVENTLKVSPPVPASIPSDTEIRENIRNMISWDSRINDERIIVEVDGGVVTLSGSVDSYWEKTIAEDIAQNATGTLDIINNLEVGIAITYTDAEIKNSIRRALARSVVVDEEHIDIEVNEGHVYLRGTAPSWTDKQEAHNIALYTSGVMDVINEIIVS